MKKIAAFILCLMLFLSCLSFSAAESAEIPQAVPAGSVQDFFGEWKMCGMIYSGTYYTVADMLSYKYISEESARTLTVAEGSAEISYLGTTIAFTAELNGEDGTLIMLNSDSKCILSLLEDGTLAMRETSPDDSVQLTDIAVVFSRKTAEAGE